MNLDTVSRPVSGPAQTRGAGRAVRTAIRSGEHRTQTAGLAPGLVQGNIAILPADWADEFLRFCHRNPRPCPLIALSEPGDPMLPALGDDIDIRTDVPRYRVFRDGKPIEEPTDITALWRDDLVTFVLGCSFSFEEALLQAGIRLRHIEEGCNVAMYRSDVETAPAGRFHGPTVMSMRPLRPADAIRAIQVTSRFPHAHGAPVHFGDPAAIGIRDIAAPDYGTALPMADGELPVFWACGVTPQSVIEHARPPLCITHMPGCMLITDRLNAELSVL